MKGTSDLEIEKYRIFEQMCCMMEWGGDGMNQPKMNPGLLRLFIIFPNVLAYCLMFGVIFFVVSNYEELKAADALNFWLILLLIFVPMTVITTFSIIKRIRAGTL